MIILVLLLVWITIWVSTAMLADRYNRSAVAWGLVAMFLGLLAFLPLLALGPRREEDRTIQQH